MAKNESALEMGDEAVSKEAMSARAALLQAVAMSTQTCLAYLDRELKFVWVNPAYVAKSGHTEEELIGCNHFDLFPNAENQAIFERVRDTGEPFEARAKPFEYADQPERGVTHWDWTLTPIKGHDGAVEGLVLSLVDVTERKRAEEQLTRAHAAVERRAAELESFISSMADAVILFDAKGNVILSNNVVEEIVGVPPAKSLDDFIARFRLCDLDGEPVPLERTVGYRALQGEKVKSARFRLVNPSGNEVFVSVSGSPVLDARGRVMGATLVFSDISETIEFERAQQELYERERHIASMLQQTLIPPRVSYQIPGVRIAVKYEPALAEAEVGGDFYDVIVLSEGRLGVLIGDVAGKGLQAAIRVAAARCTIRSYAYLDASPAVVLTMANEALCRGEMEAFGGMLTAFFAVVDAREGMMTYASGGHEPVVIRDRAGNIQELKEVGRALGVYCGYSYQETSRRLQAGDMVVMVTDGIPEARRPGPEFFGLEGVEECLSRSLTESPEEIASGLLGAAKTFAGGRLQDDVAIVVFELEDQKQMEA